jgi:hypothetical protein
MGVDSEAMIGDTAKLIRFSSLVGQRTESWLP